MNSARGVLSELRIERKPRSSTSSFKILFAVALFLTGTVLLLWWRPQLWAKEVRTVTATAAAVGPKIVLNASGYVVARRVATVSSKVTGRVRELLVEEGMKVKEGDVLARLDDSDNQTALDLAEANLHASRIATGQTKVQLDLAEKTLHRVVALANTKVETAAGLDQAVANLNSLKAQLDQQEAQILVAERQVAVFEQQMQEMIIRAPFSGVVTTKDAQPGEMISPLATGAGFSRTGICTIVDVDSLEIEIEVNENHLSQVKPGQSVIATLDAYPNWQMPAAVLAIIPTADRNKGTVKVRIKFKNRDERILPQMEIRAAFLETNPKSEVNHGILVPQTAIHNHNGNTFVWIVKDGRAERQAITVGETVDAQVLVLEGLKTGATVVTKSEGELSEGARVKAKP